MLTIEVKSERGDLGMEWRDSYGRDLSWHLEANMSHNRGAQSFVRRLQTSCLELSNTGYGRMQTKCSVWGQYADWRMICSTGCNTDLSRWGVAWSSWGSRDRAILYVHAAILSWFYDVYFFCAILGLWYCHNAWPRLYSRERCDSDHLIHLHHVQGTTSIRFQISEANKTDEGECWFSMAITINEISDVFTRSSTLQAKTSPRLQRPH